MSAVPRLCSISRISSTMSASGTPTRRASRTQARAATKRWRRTKARASWGQISLGEAPRLAARRNGPTASPGRPSSSIASPRRRKMSEAADPSCAYCTARRITSSPCCCSPSLTQAVPRMPRPLAMSARASGVSICPSGVRRKMASGAGHAPRSWTTLVWSFLLAATSASTTLVRSMADLDPAEARSSSSRMWARMRARNSLSSNVSSTPSWSSARREIRPSTRRRRRL